MSWFHRPGLLRAARIFGYIVFGIIVFLISLLLTFPTSRLTPFLEKGLSSATVQVRIGQLSLRGLSRIKLTDLTLVFVDENRDSPSGNKQPIIYAFDSMDVSFSLTRLLFKTLDAKVTIRQGNGVLGPLKLLANKENISANLEKISDFPLPEAGLPLFSVRLQGIVESGSGFLQYDREEGWSSSKARLDVSMGALRVPAPTFNIDQHGSSVTLSDISLGTMHLALVLDKRSNIQQIKADRRMSGDPTLIHIEKAEIDGPDVKGMVESHSHLRLFSGRSLKDAQMSVELTFGINEDFFVRKVTVGSEEQAPNRLLQLALTADPKWKSAETNGYWGVLCSGALGAPKCDPKKSSMRGKKFRPPARETPSREPSSKEGAPKAEIRTTPPPRNEPPTPIAQKETHPPRDEPAISLEKEPPPPVLETPLPLAPPRVTPTVIGRRTRRMQQEPLTTEAESQEVPEDLELDPEED